MIESLTDLIIVLAFVLFFFFYLYAHVVKIIEVPLIENLNDDNSSSIPLIIHQTWKTKELPESDDVPYKKCIESWKKLNPEFEYRFYTDDDCNNFVRTKFPGYYSVYSKLARIQKVDLFRYLILYVYGGVYADLDTECIKPIKPLLKDSFVTGVEYDAENNKGRTQLLQWFIACKPQSPIIDSVIRTIIHRQWWTSKFPQFLMKMILYVEWRNLKDPNEYTYWLTGPFIFSDVVTHYARNFKGSVRIYERCILGNYDISPNCKKRNYVHHYFHGQWKGKNWTKSRIRKNVKNVKNVKKTTNENLKP